MSDTDPADNDGGMIELASKVEESMNKLEKISKDKLRYARPYARVS
ncbi:hypothetical protein [Natrialba aegyptia]|nr:hypothetical protein [Natrialba aegyptia]